MIRLLQQGKMTGKIFLHSMPGRFETINEIAEELKSNNVSKIICLTDYANIKEYSDDYLVAVKKGHLDGIDIKYSPVPDFEVPQSDTQLSSYESALRESVDHLGNGNLLIHCAGGVGRTGTFAIILLRMLGYSFREAKRMVLKAESKPENDDQWDFCEHYQI